MKKLLRPFVLLSLLLLGACASQKPFTMVVLPDTQYYSATYPEIFETQTQWIADHADSIAFVLHHGDITDNNSEEQWQRAAKAMSIMDGKVPYAFVAGNHDLPGIAQNRETELFNKYFPYEKYSQTPNFGGAFEAGRMDNVWYTFKAGGKKWLVLCLEFGPRNKVLEWADTVIAEHPRHKIIMNTHAYMYSDDTRMGEGDDWLPQSYGVGKATGADAVNDGEQMWEKLLSKYPNVMLALSGHVLHRGAGSLVSTGENGNKVYQMLANYQSWVDGSVKGGNGFLRILTIDPAKKRIDVKTYSPYTGTYKTELYQQFSFEEVEF